MEAGSYFGRGSGKRSSGKRSSEKPGSEKREPRPRKPKTHTAAINASHAIALTQPAAVARQITSPTSTRPSSAA
ncbi:MAG TPA: hypothetical protein VG253_13420 [Streptosporangiaceae bacterium]|nr:hypothetical protein [Streptosporangiaceae bacterium]